MFNNKPISTADSMKEGRMKDSLMSKMSGKMAGKKKKMDIVKTAVKKAKAC